VKPISEILSLDAIRAAYAKTGMEPRAAIFIEPLCGVPLLDGYASAWCGCPASAVAVAMGVRPVDIDEAGDQVDFLAETFGVEPRLVRYEGVLGVGHVGLQGRPGEATTIRQPGTSA